MNYLDRYTQLDAQFSIGSDCCITDSDISVRFFPFHSNFQLPLLNLYDGIIKENSTFIYPVFYPANKTENNRAIVLLHGLNERKWSKYLPWAEFLCKETGRPVILFPIAFHMNRSPYAWSNPREMSNVLTIRRKRNGEDRFLSVANVALSERISEQPLRFYISGKQSLCDLTELFKTIRQGKHPLFKEDTDIDIFAYSIGAFLSQIAFMANEENLFSDSKLFMFCGGSIFSAMSGKSRSILDSAAFDMLINFYLTDFHKYLPPVDKCDKSTNSFCSMIAPELNGLNRIKFFKSLGDRINGISLEKDIVIPYKGISQAMGEDYTSSHIKLLDFDYEYSHEIPFPVTRKNEIPEIDKSFNTVFSEAAGFLA